MAEKRGRRSPGSSSSSSGVSPTQKPQQQKQQQQSPQKRNVVHQQLWDDAIRLLDEHGSFGVGGIYLGLDGKRLSLWLPNAMLIEPAGRIFYWQNHLVAAVDPDEPGRLVLYMPHTGTPQDPQSIAFATRAGGTDYVRATDADQVARVYQCIVRLLLGAQELLAEGEDWTLANSMVQDTETLPTKRATDADFVEGASWLSYLPIARSPALLWPQDWVVSVAPVSGGGFACTVLLRHQSGRASLVRVTGSVALNDKNLRIHHCLAKHFAPVVPLVAGPDIVQLGKLDGRVLRALRSNTKCDAHYWLAQEADHLNVSLSVMEYAAEGALSHHIGNEKDDLPCDWRIGLYLLCFLYASQALLGFEHGDFKASNVVLTSSFVPQIIDFDFADFYPLKTTLDAKRSLSSPWVWPPEFFSPSSTRDPQACSVLGAVDLWSYGALMLGWRAGVNNIFWLGQSWIDKSASDEMGSRRAQLAIIHKVLEDAQIWPEHSLANDTDNILPAVPSNLYLEAINRLLIVSADEHAFFVQLFSRDPIQRIMDGRFHALLEHPLFLHHLSVTERDAIIATVLAPLKGARPSTLEASREQLCALVSSAYIQQEQLRCTRCATRKALFLCTQSGRVVCGDQACVY